MLAMYRCRECNVEYTLDNFYPDKSRKGHTRRCIVCHDSYIIYKTESKKEHCNWCLGYGVFPYDGRPLGIHEVKHLFPSADCPVCKANYRLGRKSVINPNNNPHYPW